MELRTLTAEEIAEEPRRYTVEELRVGMRCRVRDMEEAGVIVIIDVSHETLQEIWFRFPSHSKPVGPYKPNHIHVLD